MPVNAVLICRVSGLTFMPTNGEFYLRATCTGYPESKRIEFEAIEMSSSLSGVYKARYSAPAGTKWSGWKSTLTNADFQCGNAALGDCSAGKITDFKITFPKAFSTIPYVIVCLRSTSTSEKYGLLTPYPTDITTKGFTFRVANAHTTTLSPGGTWYASI